MLQEDVFKVKLSEQHFEFIPGRAFEELFDVTLHIRPATLLISLQLQF